MKISARHKVVTGNEEMDNRATKVGGVSRDTPRSHACDGAHPRVWGTTVQTCGCAQKFCTYAIGLQQATACCWKVCKQLCKPQLASACIRAFEVGPPTANAGLVTGQRTCLLTRVRSGRCSPLRGRLKAHGASELFRDGRASERPVCPRTKLC